MATYNDDQSLVIALWTLALQNKCAKGEIAGKGVEAPPVIIDLVNKLGDAHTAGSVLLHTHGYDRLFFNRKIEKTITKTQCEIAKKLKIGEVINEINQA